VGLLDGSGTPAAGRTYARPPGIRGMATEFFGANADGSRLAIARERLLALWTPGDASSATLLHELYETSTWAVAVSDDGQRIATVGRDMPGTRDQTLVLLDHDGHELFRQMLPPDTNGADLTFFGTGTGTTLAVVLQTGLMRVLDVGNPRGPRVLRDVKLQPDISLHAFDRRGDRLAAVSLDKARRLEDQVRIWDFQNGRLDIRKAGHEVRALAFTSDGRTLVAFVMDDMAGAILKWDLSRQGSTADRTILYTVRDADTLLGEAVIPEYSGSEVMSPDASLLAFQRDGRIVVWDVAQGLVLGTLPLPPKQGRLRFTRDSSRILTIGDDLLTIVDVGPERLSAHACRVVGRRLTDLETRRFLGAPGRTQVCQDVRPASGSPIQPAPGPVSGRR
jgi:hypothetical protein